MRRVMRTIVLKCFIVGILSMSRPAIAQDGLRYDVVVYGGTSAAIAAAIQVKQMGKSVVIVSPDKHLGGLSSGGLGATDIGNKQAIGGIARKFYQRMGQHYNQPEAWTFEPHVAETTFQAMIHDAQVTVVPAERLDLVGGVTLQEGVITAIRTEGGKQFRGRVFIDATYEGDLMAMAGVPYHVGRESNATYSETLNGVQTKHAQFHQFKVPIDPYCVPGDPKSGLLPHIQQDGGPGAEGSGDHRIQAYCFRMCLTNNPKNRLPFPRPANYDPADYELLLRYLNAGHWTVMNLSQAMPNNKTDTNNKGAFATDFIGGNYEYPDGNYTVRERIIRAHEDYQKGLMWFLANDPRIPPTVRDEMQQWGLPKDEFTDNGGWPHQLYIREARRMISDYVMIQQNCEGTRTIDDSVGLACYTMDSHHVQRYVKDGRVLNEGDVEVGGFGPYPIAYRSIRPDKKHCKNLLVPVCLSSSHIAFGSIRMEPVFMILGQSSGTAAAMAIDAAAAVQDINIPRLQQRLRTDGQILVWKDHAGLDDAHRDLSR